MHPYNDHNEDFDEFDFDRSKALRKLLDVNRREERASHQNDQRDRFKGRRDHVNWNWQDKDDRD